MRAFLFALITTALCSTLLQAELVDLGVWGETYEIKEEDPRALVKKQFMDMNKSRIEADARSSYDEYLKVDLGLPICQKTQSRELDPTITLQKDIDLSKYGVHIKKGEKFNPLEKGFIAKHILFINTNKKEQLALIKSIPTAVTIVTDGNVNDVNSTAYPLIEQYKADKQLIDVFDVQCTPSIYTQTGDIFAIKEIAFKKRGANNETK